MTEILNAKSDDTDSASFGYDNAGDMTSVSGSLFGSWSFAYDDESRLTSVTYPSGGGSVTDLYEYNALGQRIQARLTGIDWSYLYHGDRVLQEYALGAMKRRNNFVGGGYYDLWLDSWRSGYGYRFPLYDGIGTARALADDTETITDTYSLNAFGTDFAAATGTTPNPYRYGGAWAYLTDPSGLQQLRARFYWPEIGRFISQDPIGDGMNWYAYVGNNPVVGVDPEGLDVSIPGLGGQPWLVFDGGSGRQLGMSAKATASGLITGLTMGGLSPDWRDPCDSYGSFSRNMGIGSGVALAAVASNPAAARGSFQPFWRYVGPKSNPASGFVTRGWKAPYATMAEAKDALAMPYMPTEVVPVKVPWWKPVAGPRTVAPVEGWGSGGGLEWFRGWAFQ